MVVVSENNTRSLISTAFHGLILVALNMKYQNKINLIVILDTETVHMEGNFGHDFNLFDIEGF